MPRGPLAVNLRPAARRRRAGHVYQILDRAHARNPLRRRLQPVDLLLPVHDPSKEHGAVLGVDAHVFVRHAGTAVELAFDRARERLRRRAAPGAGGERSRCAERSRPRVLSAARAHQGSALSAAHPRQPTVAHFVAAATAAFGIEDVLGEHPDRDTARDRDGGQPPCAPDRDCSRVGWPAHRV